MATVTAISTKGGGGGKASLEYICRDDKTEGKKYVTALNCSLPTAYQEFKNTREMYGKTGGIKYYHFVQSHPSGYNIAPALAHKIAVEFAERAFKCHECVVATHTDADHIHSHFILNAVNVETGLKYHSNKFVLNDLRQLSDEICQKYGVATLSKPELRQRTDGITTGEYRSAMKGESWKIDLINTIDMVMKKAKSKKQFCFYMKQKGYSVRWEDTRKYITYTCPNGRKCRDNRLHDERYRKENMEYEFKIRGNESCLQAEFAGGFGHADNCLCAGQQLAGNHITIETSDRIDTGSQGESRQSYDRRADEALSSESASNIRSGAGEVTGDTEADVEKHDFRNNKAGSSGGEIVITGWETERAVFLNAERARKLQAQAQFENVQTNTDIAVGVDSIIGGIAALASIIDEPNDEEDIDRHTDSKALAEEEKRKESLGYHMG